MISKNGFTLAEILVVMAIVAIIGIIMVGAFTNTLRGSNKSQLLSVIKQNGQAVLENMDKTIRSSDNVICIGAAANTLVVVKNGAYTRYRFFLPGQTANGYIAQDFPAPPDKKDIKSFTNTACTDPLVNLQILTDTNLRTGVSVSSGSFTEQPQSGFKAAVTVKFTLKPGTDALPAVAGQIDPVEFQTTIGLR